MENKNTKSPEQKRAEEKKIVALMIQLYCRKNHKEQNFLHQKNFLCDECKDLLEYATLRSQMCPYIKKGTKTFCNCCKTPCYKPEYREKIKKVMRFSGPRIIFFLPGKFIEHFINTKKFKKNVR